MAELLKQAQSGDGEARSRIIERLRPFVHQVASACCRRTLHWGNDDELSVALLAVNEAISTYRAEAGRQFRNHVRQVITYRLIDHFRKEGRHQNLSLDAMLQTDDAEAAPSLEVNAAWDVYRSREEEDRRTAEILEYNGILKEYGLTLGDLKEHCPKHRDTRQHLVEIARTLCEHPQLVQYLRRTKQLPLKELALVAGASRKTLETGRRYIVAMSVLILHSELEFLRTFAGLHQTRRGD